MFLSPDKSPLEVLVKDASEETNFFAVSTPRDSIPFLVDFCTDSTGSHELKGEHVVILGGARVTRSSLGRLYVPVSQFSKFVEYVTHLNTFLQNNSERLIQEVRDSR
jgi:hypothetical protein